ncbi:peptidyl-prolyl cis-trans isomerase D [Ekhidna lutea]|uniref:Peptidyl-prolyl cis-trans isomerase D n=1 Tax=Ekhidna lutea TaxID=447679 RepID=A0A239EIG4_EKHLU|nr:SurA N-terminal domain-containing protein [Ekhidna lutea]SNS43674.1 peptidyl-prolyl cis-trans isomerase D [Ekhidna lutea]
MALIGILRNKMGKIVVGAIMVTMVAFIGTDLIGNSSILGGGENPDIGEIAGESISNTQFQNKVDELSYNFAINTGRNPLQQETDQIRNQAWNALILQNAYEKQFEELGITVTNAELVDMVQGSNISPQIRQFFADPQTGQFQKENVTAFLGSLGQAQPQQRNSWIAFEQSLIPSRKLEKYANLFTKTNYVTKYEAKDEYVSQNANATIDYMYVPFLSVSDEEVSVTDAELQSYLDDHESEFQRDETRNMEYVVFDIVPSSLDSSVVANEVADFQQSLANASNDSSFVSINSDDPYPFITYNENNLPASLQGQEVGFVSEPQIVNGAYEFYKLSRIDEVAADSLLYRVAKMKKEFFVSDETINEVYRQADLFAASAGNLEEFRKLAEEQGLNVRTANRISKNAQRVGQMIEARSLVLWLYNDASTGAVSEVKEIGEKYVVAAMTAEQEEGVANLEEVRNQVERKVKNEKKAETIISKLGGLDATDLESMSAAYGEGAKTGTADFQLFSNSITGVGYAPEAIGLAFALEEEEMTQAFAVQDGVIVVKLLAKDIPADVDDYSAYALQVSRQRLGQNAMVADFPLSYFRLFVPRKIDDAVKEFADIEDMRYKFF